MKHFRTIEKRYPGMFSWPFSRPLPSTLNRYSVRLVLICFRGVRELESSTILLLKLHFILKRPCLFRSK